MTTNHDDTASNSTITEVFLSAGLTHALARLSPKQKMELSAAGGRLVAQGQFDDARFIYGLLRSIEPDNAFYTRAYGICCENTDRLDEARTALETALSADPNDAFARVGRAAVRMRCGERAGALEDLRVAEQVTQGQRTPLSRRIATMSRAASRAG